ncbi:DUF1329 domain-containing protein [Pseudomonas sp. NFX98]|uniref:DUF1329 domain-containing protein n=1 Tax=Pseudomonas sp. NFX98 TaxID=3399122 RepID=UPI0039FC5171
MKIKKTTLCVTMLSVLSFSSSHAAVTATEAAKLGSSLTPWGAEKQGNADGSIPEYKGGMTKPPKNYVDGSNKFVDPFADEKPIVSITAANIGQYKDKLTPGTMELLKRWPDYRVDVYPSHRSYPAMSAQRSAKTVANATDANCRTESDGVGLAKECRGGIPFPIPKTGNEAMWNHLTREMGTNGAFFGNTSTYIVDSAGNASATKVLNLQAEYPYWQDKSDSDFYTRAISTTLSPAKDSGSITLIWYPMRYDTQDQRTWSYSTGQRRVRLAPEFAYDTPISALGGGIYYDESNMFSGRMDRFDYKLIGKQEIYIPYNTFKLATFPAAGVNGKQHVNPDAMRWELHRVWVVEATVKNGLRHTASKRRYYLDEDTWRIHLYDGYDQAGKIFRTLQANAIPNYIQGAGTIDFTSSLIAYDLARGGYTFVSQMGADNASYKPVNEIKESTFSAQAIAGQGVR